MQKLIPIQMKGIVIAAAWGEHGDITAVDIAGYDEKRYRVADDLVGRQLKQLIKERLIVDGMIEKTGNRNILHVKAFQRDDAAKDKKQCRSGIDI
ncbi:hypothetical protein [Desulfosarcina ovata]|uniref:Uncharacterized protein n=1 Tax=Desulfosarcina ovata subsp. ovata TaxID=2752305 RepID=A0A5K8AHN1_9BACT|nr:hypothetical protein [Desulfosarcina ovata]BBO91370.1 hypothetical protein DSCOOX_45500 [Desulfosarcina ovata subsp. ovata]